jgi:hypothetical protein
LGLRDTAPVRAGEANHRASGRPDPSLSIAAPACARERVEGRAALAGAGRPSEVSRVPRGSGAERSASWVRRSRQAVSAAFRCSLPLRGPKDRRLGPRLSQPRAPRRAHSGGATPTVAGRFHPPRATAPSAHEGSRIRSSRACHTRHLPPSAFRTPSAAYTPRSRPGLFHPGNAPGVPPSGPCSSPGGPDLSRGRLALLPFASRALATPRGSAVFRAFISPESPCDERPKIPRRRCPPGVLPSKALPASAVGPDLPAAARPRGRTTTDPPGPSSPALSPNDRVAPTSDRRSGVSPGGGPGVSSPGKLRPLARARLTGPEAPALLGFATSSRAAR